MKNLILCILLLFILLIFLRKHKKNIKEIKRIIKNEHPEFVIRDPLPNDFENAYKQLPDTAKYQRQIGIKYHPLGFEIRKLSPELKVKLRNHWKVTPNSYEPMPGVVLGTNTSDTSKSLLNIKSLQKYNKKLYNELNKYIEDILLSWTRVNKLTHRSTYGPREYKRGSYLVPHVDRGETHILSAIVNIDQDVEKDWKLVVYDHNNNKHEIVMDEDHDLVLYESATVIHGRPVPLEGDSYINIFMHFETPEWRSEVVSKMKQKYPGWSSSN